VVTVANPSVSHGHGECVPAADILGPNSFDPWCARGSARRYQIGWLSGVPVYVHDGPDVASGGRQPSEAGPLC